MSDEDLLDVFKNCSENDLEDMIDGGNLKNINKKQLKSLLNNPNINFGQYIIMKICSCPFMLRNSTRCSQYRVLFSSIRNYEPLYLEAALEEYFIDNYIDECFDSMIWSALGENESLFLIQNPKFNFVEDLLNAMYMYYDDLGEMIQLYEWYNYTFSSPDVFFQEVQFFKYHDLITKILNKLEKNDESEIAYIISLNLLKFVNKRSIYDLLNSPKSNLFETFIKIFAECEKACIYDNFELCEDLIYQLGDLMTKNLKDKVIHILEDGKIDSLNMIFKFRWLEYFNQNDLIELNMNSKINFSENFGKIIFGEILDEHNYYRGIIFKYLPRILLNVLKFIDKEFLKKIFERDELYSQNKEDFISLLKEVSDSVDKQRSEDINQILIILNNKK